MRRNAKSWIRVLLLALLPLTGQARSWVMAPEVKTLQVVVNQDWLSMPVMQLGSNDVLHVSFDELSHDYHRYLAHLEHCEADWTPSESIFEADWLEGFNDLPIDDYQNSINTTVSYTHYSLQLPNDRCRLRLSGNYRLYIVDEDDENRQVACAEFMVLDSHQMLASMEATTNTDVDHNLCHQQLSFTLNYNGYSVTRPDEQLHTVVMQNAREDTRRENLKPSQTTPFGLQWAHNRSLIFDAGNEYRKFEVLDVSHTTMGLERMDWDGQHYNAYPYVGEPRLNYLYDQDANGAFYIRNSDNQENDITCDYVQVHYRLHTPQHPEGTVFIDGQWATGQPETYQMDYDESLQSYVATILQKQGYYSYQYLMRPADGTQPQLLPEEGNFFQTENKYQLLVYYKGITDRTWRLTAYQQIQLAFDGSGDRSRQ